MTGTLEVAWDDGLIDYDFGPGHPLAPVRVELTIALARAFGIFDDPSVRVAAPRPATTEELELVHEPGYIAAVQRAGRTGQADLRHGLGTADDPVFSAMHEASA